MYIHAQTHSVLTYIHETRRMSKYYTYIHMSVDKSSGILSSALLSFWYFTKKSSITTAVWFLIEACTCTPCDFFAVTLIQSESNTGSNMAKTLSQKMKKARLHILRSFYTSFVSNQSILWEFFISNDLKIPSENLKSARIFIWLNFAI